MLISVKQRPPKPGWYGAHYNSNRQVELSRYWDGKFWLRGKFPKVSEDKLQANFGSDPHDKWSFLLIPE